MNIEDAILEKTKHCFQLNSLESDAQALALLISQARSIINIYSEQLNPAIFNKPFIVNACQQFCSKNSRTKINILVKQPRALTLNSHRLLALSQRHSSSIFFKKTHPDYLHRSDEFCCIDRTAYFRLMNSEHYQANCDFSDNLLTGDLLSFFKDAWEHSATDHELHSFLL